MLLHVLCRTSNTLHARTLPIHTHMLPTHTPHSSTPLTTLPIHTLSTHTFHSPLSPLTHSTPHSTTLPTYKHSPHTHSTHIPYSHTPFTFPTHTLPTHTYPYSQSILSVHETVRTRSYETPIPSYDPNFHPQTNYQRHNKRGRGPEYRTIGLHKSANEPLVSQKHIRTGG